MPGRKTGTKEKKVAPEPFLGNVFTCLSLLLFCLWGKLGSNNGWLPQFVTACVAVAIATELVGSVAKWVATRGGANVVNVAKTHEQLWQFAVVRCSAVTCGCFFFDFSGGRFSRCPTNGSTRATGWCWHFGR